MRDRIGENGHRIRRCGASFFGRLSRALVTLVVTAGPAMGQVIDQAVVDAVERTGHATAFVVLDAGPPEVSAGNEDLVARCARYAHAQEGLLASLPEGAYEVRYRYRYSPCLFLDVFHSDVLSALHAMSRVRSVQPDIRGRGGLSESRVRIGADAVQAAGLNGAGLTVAVIDSGIVPDHPDLADAVVHEWHFLDQGNDIGEGAVDEYGHGTNVSGIIASRGILTPPGIAPASRLVSIRVLDRFGSGWFSDWAAALEHVVSLHEQENGIELTAINMSLASRDRFEGVCDDRFPQFFGPIDAAVTLGIVVAAASGNNGSISERSSPACLSPVISVGATYDNTVRETIWPLTNRNELLDLLAPGAVISGAGIDHGTGVYMGTSQATAHVSAGAAILREVDATLSPDEIREILQSTGVFVFDPESSRSFPRIDLEAAVRFVVQGMISPHFRRGDVSDDATLETTDAVQILNFLFLNGGLPACLDAADVDNNAEIDISDAVLLLSYLFIGGLPPARPGPLPQACGIDPDEPGVPGDLGCREYESC